MLKDYSKEKFNSFDDHKCFKIIYNLILFIEKNKSSFDSKHFEKLKKYHLYLEYRDSKFSQMLVKEYHKVGDDLKQFQIYITFLERLIGNSSQEYDFLMKTGDQDVSLDRLPITCVIDGVRSLHNVGAIIRNCECLGLEKVIISKPYSDYDTSQMHKTSMGAHEYIECTYTEDILNSVLEYKSRGYHILSLDTGQDSIEIDSFKVDGPVMIILGHEQFGIDLKILKVTDTIAHIPMRGQKNSLNVAVASGIAFAALSKQFV